MADRVANTFDEAAEPAWDFAASPYRPDLVVIDLGSNDFSTLPHPSRDEFAAAYTRILQTLRGAYGDEMPILCVAPRVSEPAFTYIRELVSVRRRAEPPFRGYPARLLQRRERTRIVGPSQLCGTSQDGDAADSLRFDADGVGGGDQTDRIGVWPYRGFLLLLSSVRIVNSGISQ